MVNSSNIGTLAATVVVKDTVKADMGRIKSQLQGEMKAVQEAMANPFAEAERQLASILRGIERLASKSTFSLLSDRELTKLQSYASLVDQITSRVNTLGGGQVGMMGITDKLNITRQALGTIGQIGITNPLSNMPVVQSAVHSRFIFNPATMGLPEGYGPIPFSRMSGAGFSDDQLWQARLSAAHARSMNPYGAGSGGLAYGNTSSQRSQILDQNRELARTYEIQDRHAHQLAKRVSMLTEEEQKRFKFNVRAAQELGREVSTSVRAVGMLEDPRGKFNTGRGSYSHALQYGTQNAAFALEDFLISSQYGGVKAGLRAMTNNLTAITAAATGFMNPFLGAALIGGVAVGGALAPSIYGAMSGDDERRTDLIGQLASPRDSITRTLTRQFQSRMSAGRGVNSARQQYEESLQAVARFDAQKADIMRGVSSQVNRVGSETIAPSEWVYAAFGRPNRLTSFGGTVQAIGGVADWFMNNNTSVNRGRGWDELRVASDARQLRDKANANIKGLGDRNLLEQDVEARKLELDRERRLEQMDFNLQNRMTPLQVDLATRQLRGELINPREQFEIDKAARFVRAANFRDAFRDQPDRLRDLDQQIIQEQRQAELNLPFQEAQFQIGLRNRDWQHRLRLADFELDPRKRLAAQVGIERERILADRGLTGAQQDAQLAGLAKLTKRQLEQMGEYPGLGDAITVGSAEDVRLRQRIFDKSGGTGKQTESEMDLKELVRIAREQLEETKKNKPKAAAIRKR